jgi:hypothetical protein
LVLQRGLQTRASFCDVCIFNFTPREKGHQVSAGQFFFSLTERDGRHTARIVIASSAEVQYYPAVIAAEMDGTEDRIVQEPKTHGNVRIRSFQRTLV